jgi:hypothetical protein
MKKGKRTNHKMKHLLLLIVALLFAVSAANATPIVTTNPGSFGGHDMELFSSFNANYTTPQTFNLPADVTFVSFFLTAAPESMGVPFSLWLNKTDSLADRFYSFNVQDSLPTFIGITSTTPMDRIILTTPNSGYGFTISNFQGGPFAPVVPPPVDPPPTEGSETPELGTMLLMGTGLIAIGKARRWMPGVRTSA